MINRAETVPQSTISAFERLSKRRASETMLMAGHAALASAAILAIAAGAWFSIVQAI